MCTFRDLEIHSIYSSRRWAFPDLNKRTCVEFGFLCTGESRPCVRLDEMVDFFATFHPESKLNYCPKFIVVFVVSEDVAHTTAGSQALPVLRA